MENLSMLENSHYFGNELGNGYIDNLLLLRKSSEMISDEGGWEIETYSSSFQFNKTNLIPQTIKFQKKESEDVNNLNLKNELKEEAFAKLQGRNWEYYLKKLSIIIGRKTPLNEDVDVDLCPSKMISRRHLRINYNYQTRKWELDCIGKNPVKVNDFIFLSETKAI